MTKKQKLSQKSTTRLIEVYGALEANLALQGECGTNPQSYKKIQLIRDQARTNLEQHILKLETKLKKLLKTRTNKLPQKHHNL